MFPCINIKHQAPIEGGEKDQASKNYVTASTCGLAFPSSFLELTANAIESILGDSHGLGIKRGARLIQ
jgi:hypothetical protein